MKVLFQSRKTLFTVRGGDTVQILKTKEYLERLGVTAEISVELEPDLRGFDIVTLFNIVRPQEIYYQLRNAKRRGVKAALATVYCDTWPYEVNARKGALGWVARNTNRNFVEALKVGARMLTNGELQKGIFPMIFKGYMNLQREIIRQADLFLPNSASEFRRLEEDIGLKADPDKIEVIPNAFDASFYDPALASESGLSSSLLTFKDCILCMARVEGRKNQLNLVRAMKGLPYRLVIAGEPAPNHVAYFEQMKKEASNNVTFLGYVDEETKRALYSIARVHVLPSWMETTGLSTLEAAAMGCNVVITDKGDTREYFRDEAVYCDPGNVASIASAVDKAWKMPRNAAFINRIRTSYTWEVTAEKTKNAFEKLFRA